MEAKTKKWGDIPLSKSSNTIRFFGQKSKYAIFSNFAPTPVTINGLLYPTTEHYFQSMKFIDTDPEYAEIVRLAKTPGESKKLGKSREHPIDPDWSNSKKGEGKSIMVMRRALLSKALQHQKFREMLLSTGTAHIIEASPFDSYWGEGRDKKGKNMLGVLLMELRSIVKRYKDTMYCEK